METKNLAIAVIENEGKILLRKKPAGSPPYPETWYIFGAEVFPGEEPKEKLAAHLREALGVEVLVEKDVGVAEETKKDNDGETKYFVYQNFVCRYVGGEPQIPAGAERIEWVEKEKLAEYDLVPPSVELFKKLGYL